MMMDGLSKVKRVLITNVSKFSLADIAVFVHREETEQ
jgi:hypothetical protein